MRQTQSFLAGLHFIEWGGPLARWLNFVAGLLSSAMVATALILFIAKREARQGSRPLMLMAKSITVAAVAGNIIACLAYLYGERLMPAEVVDRRSSLATVYFVAWLLTLAHAGLRRYPAAWRAQLAVAALLCLCLRVLSEIAGVGLASTARGGDWIRFGADMTALASGALLALITVVLSRCRSPPVHRRCVVRARTARHREGAAARYRHLRRSGRLIRP